jgi:hypothetical protein
MRQLPRALARQPYAQALTHTSGIKIWSTWVLSPPRHFFRLFSAFYQESPLDVWRDDLLPSLSD